MTGDASSMRSLLRRAPTPTRYPRQSPATRNELLALARERAHSPLPSLRKLAATSPGKLFMITTVLVVVAVLSGWYASTVLDNRTAALTETIDDTEPIAESAQVLYSSLSIADATANTAFTSGGLEPQSLRTRYNDALATASQALIAAAAGTSNENEQVRADLNLLSEQIPVYAGLIESARVNNRLGNPVGSAYLGEASSLMQTSVLPAAERLYEKRSQAISDPQNRFKTPPWAVYVVITLMLAILLLTSRYLARRTRRRLNLGLLVATACVVVSMLWLLIAGLLSVGYTSSAENKGAGPLRDLTHARILTQKARSDETLSLVRRGDSNALESDFASSAAQIKQTLDSFGPDGDNKDTVTDAIVKAQSALITWQQAHTTTVQRTAAGDFSGATAIAVGNSPDGSAVAYGALDAALTDGITQTRTTLRDDLTTARVVLGFAGTGVLALLLVAAVATVAGMFPRIREYR
ncbi:hypothetical protein [Williamsia sterculiae]|uniref:Uncharacterized protein n=1 Tax=Williamsia sterculiae TaxID=1344003 RepID=A0A1N7F1U1_9NOCA|nr:hypothetical protein [Williamsia sterculiae]SIR94182.1 hypothetical protein SAMN05445060_1719 [Williamsia sterculiae]